MLIPAVLLMRDIYLRVTIQHPCAPDVPHPERRTARGAPRLGHLWENIKTSLKSKLFIRGFYVFPEVLNKYNYGVVEMNVCELRTKYQRILEMPLMKYDTMRLELSELILENEDDTRKGIVSIVEQARKKIKAIDQETERVRGMMAFEEKYSEYSWIAGIDEVGRGPLAGPVLTAAVILPKGCIIPGLNDSKQLTAKQREELYDIIMSNAIAVGVGMNSEKVIDEKGIEFANKDAMRQAISHLQTTPDLLLVDAVHIPDISIKQVSIIKGDAKSVSIAAASVVAKVTRDRMMQDYDLTYPQYHFGDNMGYGSAAHLEALREYGPCPIHRESYIKKIMERFNAE